MRDPYPKGYIMSDNIPTADAIVTEVEKTKKKFFRKPNLRVTKTKLRNSALLVGAGAVAVLATQKYAGKTIDIDVSTADIDTGSDSND